MAFDWKETLQSVAPGLATALGGPLAGAAVKVLGEKLLGKPEASEDEVVAALSNGSLTGEQITALKVAEQNFTLEMARIDAATESTLLADTASARAQTADLARSGSVIAWGAPLVSILVIGGYFLCIWLLFVRGDDLPDNLAQLVSIMFGALQLGFGQVINYWLGSSAGSKKSGDAIRAIATRKS